MRADSIELGFFVRPVGLKGEVKLAIGPDFWDECLDSRRLEIEMPGGTRPVRVLSSREAKGGLVVRLDGVGSREEAETLRNCPLRLRGEPDIALPEQPRPFQILGMSVVDRQGEAIGEVSGLQLAPGQPLMRVKGEERDYDIPFISPILSAIDWEGGRIVIDPPPGLLEI